MKMAYDDSVKSQGQALGLTWQDAVYGGDESGTPISDAGMYDSKGNLIAPETISLMSATLLRNNNPNADPNMLLDYASFANDPGVATGALLRKQYYDYVKRYQESEDALMNMTTYNNPDLVDQEINKAVGMDGTNRGYVQKAMDTAEANQSYGMQKLGVQQTREGMQSRGMQNSLARSTAVVDAANKIRLRQSDRNKQIATGVVPNAGRAYGLKSETGGA